MTKEIELFNHKIANKELLTDSKNLESILTEIRDLENSVFDLSTTQGIDDAKDLKSTATKWIKELKQFCEPHEAEGKKISDARSLLTTTLLTGKESVINKILDPITTIEKKLKDLRLQVVTPINDLQSCDLRLQEAEELKDYNWLAYEKEAINLINQQILLVTSVRNRIENEAKAEQLRLDNERREREAFIAENAAEQATKKAEERIKKEQEQKEEQEQEKSKETAELLVEIKTDMKKQNEEHKRKIHNEILDALCKLPCQSDGNFTIDMKFIIKAIARGEIPHLTINY